MSKRSKTNQLGIDLTSRLPPEAAHVHPALKRFLGYCLYKSAMRIRAMMDTALEPHGLVAPQSGILNLIHHTGPISQNDLGFEMCIDKTTMVKLIDGLEEMKLVTRESDPKDRRVKKISLTPAGEKKVKALLEVRARVESEFLSPLSAEERRVLAEAIPKLLR